MQHLRPNPEGRRELQDPSTSWGSRGLLLLLMLPPPTSDDSC